MKMGNRVVVILVLVSILVGIAVHLSFVFRQTDMLADRPFRDDGFYALTVSRNLATGEGLSVSDGEIATNGIQPLFVYLCTLPYFLSQNRFEAIRLVQGLNLIVHLLSALALFYLVRRFAKEKATPWVASAFFWELPPSPG